MHFNDVYRLLEETEFYNSSLNPKFWKNNEFDKDVHAKLMNIADDFISDDLKPLVDDIQLTGSLANFNYTKYSDLDVHILLEFDKVNEDVDLVKSSLDGKRFIWNLRHNVVIRGHEVELYYQDTNEPHIASGLFSLKDNAWIKEPQYNPPEIDEDDVYKKADNIVDSINRLVKLVDGDISSNEAQELYDAGKRLKDKIVKMRRSGLKKYGEFAVENLAFKVLRNNNAIGDLIDAIHTSYDKIYSEGTVNEDLMSIAKDLSNSMPKMAGEKKSKYDDPDPNTKFHLGHTLRGMNRKTQKFISDVHRADGSENRKIEILKQGPGKFACNLADAKYIQKNFVPDLFAKPPTQDNPKQLNRTKIIIFYDEGKNLFYIERHA